MLSRLTGPVDVHDVQSHITHSLPWHGRENATLAGGIPIRLMFIGASITLGEPEQAGYRRQVRDWIVGLGNPVNCVGSLSLSNTLGAWSQNRFGDLKDNDVEAFPARRVKDLTAGLPAIVPQSRPNLVLVHAGASDCFQDPTQGSAHALDHTQELVEYLFEAGDATPRAGARDTKANTTAAAASMVTVILSTLITSPNPAFERCIQSFNAQIRQVVTDLARDGRHIALADMHPDQGLLGRPGLQDIQADGMHPTSEGWRMMGDVFKRAIREVEHKGWLKAPVDNGIPANGNMEN
ncbi:carbohydrate esterase family 3 protein [Apiospora marii]|uniref:Carbohydrate esterase family 3 protein n=1 Tax=Apiospora marii TaxID=335849 RepID=A0ABR1RE97_9PEZI